MMKKMKYRPQRLLEFLKSRDIIKVGLSMLSDIDGKSFQFTRTPSPNV